MLAVEAGGRWEAALPVFEKRRGPFVAAALPPLCPVHRPLLAAPLSEAESHRRSSPLDRLLAGLDGAVDQATLALGDDDLRPYAWAGWDVTPRATYLLPLGGDVEARFSSSTRRVARKEAGAFEVVEAPGLAADAVRLMVESYRRHGTDLGLDASAVAGLAGAFVEAGLARVFAARRGGAVEASVVVAADDRAAYYWIAGSAPGPAMTVLLADTIGRLAAEGLEAFDFVGANVPGIAEFKRKFGPALAPAPIARRTSSRALRLAKRVLG